MKMNRLNLLLFSLCLTLPTIAFASVSFNLTSNAEQTLLLELYTSEGCSSCPPADRWLSKFKQDPRLWKLIVPVAFHVDYWNYLGWSDKFSRLEFSSRQRQYASLRYANTVYTPGFFQNGREWRGWFSKPSIELNTAAQAKNNVGVLTVSISDNKLSAKFSPSRESKWPLKLNVAQLGLGIKSKIEDGENEGKTFTHDFVVLSHQIFIGRGIKNVHHWDTNFNRLTLDNGHTKSNALAIWVTAGDDPTPIQAVGGEL